MTKQEAWALLTEYNHEEFHQHHARTVGAVMRWYAEKLGYGDEADFWEIVGILHDLDFEMYPEQHCKKEVEIMRGRGLDERLIHAAACHGWGLCTDLAPEHEMEKVLFAADELTGLIGAAALMRPSKSVRGGLPVGRPQRGGGCGPNRDPGRKKAVRCTAYFAVPQ